MSGSTSGVADERYIIPPPWIANWRTYERRAFREPPDGNDTDVVLKLDSNEGIEPPQFIVDRLITFLRQPGEINHYPNQDCHALRRGLSTYTGCPVQQIVPFCGADGALEAIARAFLARDDEAIIVSPSYDQFRVFVELAGARPRFVNAGESVRHFNRANFQEGCHLSHSAKLIYLINPNNPMGYLIENESIIEVARAFPNRLLVVDETCIEFSSHVSSSTQLFNHVDNVVVVRSFSKAFGLAGLRLGYAISNRHTAKILENVRNVKSVTTLAQIAGLAVLDNIEYFRTRAARTQATRDWFLRALRAAGIVAHDTNANFVLIETDAPFHLSKSLAGCGIYVRDLSCIDRLERYLRITVTTQPEMAFVLKALIQSTNGNQPETIDLAQGVK